MPTYCFIKDVYPSWSGGQQIQNQIKSDNNQDGKAVEKQNQDRVNKYSGGNCPNCNHHIPTLNNGSNCVQQNTKFQNQNYETALRPLPRWVPQHRELQPWDPYSTRTFRENKTQAQQSCNLPQRRVEGFGNVAQHREHLYYDHHPYRVERFGNSLDMETAQGLVNLVFYLLILLFIIQFIELVFKMARGTQPQ